jgi:DNA-binding transcriptional regulator YiaG
MTASSLKARFERLAQGPDAAPAPSASAVTADLRLSGRLQDCQTVPAILALAHSGPSLLQAKRAVEAVIEGGTATLSLSVPDIAALTDQLAASGFCLRVITPPAQVDVPAIRRATGMTQEVFARRFGLDLATLRKWESGRSRPETAVRSYLALIAKDWEGVLRLAGRG